MLQRTVAAPVLVVAALLLGSLGAAPAQAKPAPAPTGLAADVVARQDGSFDVAATWNAVPKASSYRVKLSANGTTLASTTVPAASWSPSVTTAPGEATLSVRAVVGRSPGKTATLKFALPDEVAPRGTFSSSWNNNTWDATITQESLTDNAGAAGITRTVDWNDGSGAQAWGAGTTIDHTYPPGDARYVPTVTLEDAAGNVRVVDVPAIVFNDSEAPTGTFATGPATAWATLTKVTVTQSALADNRTPPELIRRSVDWGDGAVSEWTGGTTLQHVYAAAGSFTPTVTITDEAGNETVLPTSQVVVSVDATGPVVRLKVPKNKRSVKAWTTLHGKATDSGTGVKTVRVRAVEKRAGSWYGYDSGRKTWRKAGTKAKALSRCTPFTLRPDARHRWSAKLVGLRKGTLVVDVRASDKVGNRSKLLTHQATLTRR